MKTAQKLIQILTLFYILHSIRTRIQTMHFYIFNNIDNE